MASVERHAEISAIFLAHAEDCLRAGDLLQASEKAWGATAHCLKSIAKLRNWPSGTHQALKIIMTRLALGSDETAKIATLYKKAEMLHTNFYEDGLDYGAVERGVADVKELIAILQEFA